MDLVARKREVSPTRRSHLVICPHLTLRSIKVDQGSTKVKRYKDLVNSCFILQFRHSVTKLYNYPSSLTRFYTVGRLHIKIIFLISPKLIMDISKSGRQTNLLKEFKRLRIKVFDMEILGNICVKHVRICLKSSNIHLKIPHLFQFYVYILFYPLQLPVLTS